MLTMLHYKLLNVKTTAKGRESLGNETGVEQTTLQMVQARIQGWFGWFQRTPLTGLEVAVFCRETTGPL